MKLTKKKVEIVTDLIKKGEIIELEHVVEHTVFRCLVTAVDKDKICVLKIDNFVKPLTISAEELDKYKFRYLKLVYRSDSDTKETKIKWEEKPVEQNEDPLGIDRLIMSLLEKGEANK